MALLLAGCQLGTPVAATSGTGSSPSTTPTPSVTAPPSPAAAAQADITGYLLQGTPYLPDANGEWSGHYGFYTDASKSVACDIWIFSGDSGGVSCNIEVGHESQRSYTLPAGVTSTCTDAPGGGYQTDGTEIDINYKIFPDPMNVGFAGCLSDSSGADPAVEAKRVVLPPNTVLTVTQTGFETYTCSAAAGIASCSDSAPGSSFVFGLSVATFHQG